MIIVSQDRSKAINMNKVLSIYRSNKDIGAEYPFEDVWADLGRYETENRAKEVFEEIMTKYENWENLKYGQPSGTCLPKYEMPEE